MDMLNIEKKFAKEIRLINDYILDYTDSRYSLIKAAVRNMIKGGGKRLRPLFMMQAAKFGNYEQQKVLKIASGLEILHMATLVHDDIIDDASIRRGKETVQNKYGKDIAVFVGDFFLSKANSLFARYLSSPTLVKLNDVINLICEGEIKQYQEKFNHNLNIGDYFRRIRRKTALFFGMCAYIGGYESGIRNRKLYNLYNLGLETGMAFQIRDDILDYTASGTKTGKDAGQDLFAGVYTLPVINLFQNDNKITAEFKNEIENKDGVFKKKLTEKEAEKISQRLKTGDYIKKCKILEKRFTNRAFYHLEQLPGEEIKENFNYILRYQLHRKK